MATPTKLVTYEEWLRMPESDQPEEVVDGEIRTMPPNKAPHPEIVQALNAQFSHQLDPRIVQIFGSYFGLVIRQEPLVCRAPDLAIYKRASMVMRDGYYHSPPELVIEVLSESEHRASIGRKLRDYESIGVPEVWLVSPEARTVEVLRLENGRLIRQGIHAEGQLRPLHFPEAAIDIAAIWPA